MSNEKDTTKKMEPRQESRKKENGKKESGKIRQADTLREVMHHLGRYRIFLVFSILLASATAPMP